MSLGQRIARLRKQLGLSQFQLADRIHVNRSTLANWETDRADPDTEALSRLADALGTTVDYLLGRTDLPAPAPGHNPLYDRFPWLRRLPPAMQPDAIAAVQGGALEHAAFRDAIAFDKLDDHTLALVMKALIEDWQDSQHRRRLHEQKGS